MKAIVLSFTLKGQDFDEIKSKIVEIKENVGDNVLLIHGFLPRKEAIERGLPTDVQDFFDEHFPVQLNMYNKGVLRTDMALIADKLDADVYIIGDIVGGVSEELDLYRASGVFYIETIQLLNNKN